MCSPHLLVMLAGPSCSVAEKLFRLYYQIVKNIAWYLYMIESLHIGYKVYKLIINYGQQKWNDKEVGLGYEIFNQIQVWGWPGDRPFDRWVDDTVAMDEAELLREAYLDFLGKKLWEKWKFHCTYNVWNTWKEASLEKRLFN